MRPIRLTKLRVRNNPFNKKEIALMMALTAAGVGIYLAVKKPKRKVAPPPAVPADEKLPDKDEEPPTGQRATIDSAGVGDFCNWILYQQGDMFGFDAVTTAGEVPEPFNSGPVYPSEPVARQAIAKLIADWTAEGKC